VAAPVACTSAMALDVNAIPASARSLDATFDDAAGQRCGDQKQCDEIS
jgi:hypothetical protein